MPIRLALTDGSVVEFDTPEQAQEFQRQRPDLVIGPDTPELRHQRRLSAQYSSGAAQLATGLIGAADEFTLGAPRVLAGIADAATGSDVLPTMRDMAQANPTADVAGRVAGGIGAGIAGGAVLRAPTAGARLGLGLAAPGAGAAALAEGTGQIVTRALAGQSPGLARGILARTAGLGVEGALDASLVESARLVTEEALGDTHLTAEQALVEVGRAGMFGGAVGGGIGGVLGLGTAGRRALGSMTDAISQTWAARTGTELHPTVARGLAAAETGDGDLLTRLRRGGEDGRRLLAILEGGDETLDDGARELVDELNRFNLDALHVEDHARGELRRQAVRRRVSADGPRLLRQLQLAHQQIAAARELAQQLRADPLFGPMRVRELEQGADAFERVIAEALEHARQRQAVPLPRDLAPEVVDALPVGEPAMDVVAPSGDAIEAIQEIERAIMAAEQLGPRATHRLRQAMGEIVGREMRQVPVDVEGMTPVPGGDRLGMWQARDFHVDMHHATPEVRRRVVQAVRAQLEAVRREVAEQGVQARDFRTNPGGRRGPPIRRDVAPVRPPGQTALLPGRSPGGNTIVMGERHAVMSEPDFTPRQANDLAAEVFIRLDQLKRQVGELARTTDHSAAAAAFQDLYGRMRAPLEDAGLWGDELATMQREVNAAWNRYLREAGSFNQMFTAPGPRDPLNAWRVLREADPGRIRSFLGSHGTARNDRRMRIFQDVLRARAELHATIGRHMDLPPQLLAAASRAPWTIRRMQRTLARVGERAQILNQWRAATADDRRFRSIAAMLGQSAMMAGVFGMGPVAAALGLGAVLAGIRGNRANIARGVAHLRGMSGRVEVRVGDSVRTMLNRSARAGRRTAAVETSRYRDRTQLLDRESDMPGSVTRLANATQGLEDLPRVRQALQLSHVRGTMFLQGVRPRARVLPGTLVPDRHADPSRAEVERFMRYARAVDEPSTILDDMRDGHLTREAAEAMRVVYPALHAMIVRRVQQELSDGSNPSYANRIQLGILLGTVTDPSLTPAFLATVQGAHSTYGVSQPQRQSAARTPSSSPNTARQVASDSDRLVARRSLQQS